MSERDQTIVIDGREARVVPCSPCQSDCADTLFVRHQFAYQRCCRCGLVRVNPQLTSPTINAIYREGYASKARAHTRGPLIEPPQQLRALDELTKVIGQGRRLLDVGCFEGQFLRLARNLGWEVTGTEISEAAAVFGRAEWGLDIRLGTLESLTLPAGSFDAAVLRDVVEHLPQPARTLAEVARVLRPGGGLYIWTPNFDSLTRRMILGPRWGAVVFPWHLYYFTPSTLVRSVEKSSFEVVSVTTRNWLLDSRDRYLALQRKEDLAPRSRSVQRLHRLIDRVSRPLFAWAGNRGWHWGAQIELYARKRA